MSPAATATPSTDVIGPTAPHRQPPPLAVAWQLARREGPRLVRHPIVLLGAVLSLLLIHQMSLTDLPFIPQEVAELRTFLLPWMAGLFLASNLAGQRAHRHDVTDLYRSLVTPTDVRTQGHLLASLWALAATLVLAGIAIAYWLAFGGGGWPRIEDLVAIGAQAVLASVLGTAVARLVPNRLGAMVGLASLTAWQIVAGSAQGSQTGLAPALTVNGYLPLSLQFTPTWPHTLYVLGITSIAATAALIRSRATTRRVVAVTVALLVTLGSIVALAAVPTDGAIERRVQLLTAPEDHRTCQTRDDITYCAYPEYTHLIDRWDNIVTSVIRAAPAKAAPADLTVNQVLGGYGLVSAVRTWRGPAAGEAFAASLPEHVLRPSGTDQPTVGTTWDAPGQASAAGAVAGQVAAHIIGVAPQPLTYTWTADDIQWLQDNPWAPSTLGLASDPAAGDTITYQPNSCWLVGQAREVAALWLVAQATPHVEAVLREAAAEPYAIEVADERGTSGYSASGPELHVLTTGEEHLAVTWSRPGAWVALQLLDDPEASRQLADNWQRWTSADATTDELIAELGLPRIPSVEEVLRAKGVANPDQFAGDESLAWLTGDPDATWGAGAPPPVGRLYDDCQ